MLTLVICIIAVSHFLSPFCKGATPYCSKGKLSKWDIDAQVLRLVNKHRSKLANGKEQHLPAGKGIMKMNWSCDLEEKALRPAFKGYPSGKPTTPVTMSGIYLENYDYGATLSTALNNILSSTDTGGLYVSSEGVIYNGQKSLSNYANLIRSTASEIGCAFKTAELHNPSYSIYCLTNKPELKAGDMVYETVQICSWNICPKGSICNDKNGLCEFDTRKEANYFYPPNFYN